MPQSEISVWLQFALQQMAAESYLDGIDWSNAEQVKIQLGEKNGDILHF
jgi:hypothetical protein